MLKALNDVAYAETNTVGHVGASLVHAALWGGYLGNWEYGFMKTLRDVARKYFPETYSGVIAENYEDDAGLEIFGFQEEPGAFFLANIFTALHHGSAGGLMLLGHYKGWPWLWRHGLLTQMAGMDICDFLRVAVCKMFPPGPFPMSRYIENTAAVSGLFFHHSVSICCGLPVNLFFSDRPDFQWFGVMMTGAPVAMVTVDLIRRLIPRRYERTHTLSEAFCCANFLHQRAFYFFPATYRLMKQVMNESLPWWIKGSFMFAAFNLSVFNVVALSMQISQFIKKRIVAPAELLPARSNSSLVLTPQVLAATIEQEADRNLTHFFVSSKLVAKAHAARKRLQACDENAKVD
eukprot:TRINITY_DN19637_c0_g1_i1.p1 TRINITY_DN19637_c0_g1~~TRINITY_DN19637_c0_g1_i1.p1  ORF type:complete len:358 (-),score=38.75 TRINITY_DN19637_c0_g1_i1:164-1207(-)